MARKQKVELADSGGASRVKTRQRPENPGLPTSASKIV